MIDGDLKTYQAIETVSIIARDGLSRVRPCFEQSKRVISILIIFQRWFLNWSLVDFRWNGIHLQQALTQVFTLCQWRSIDCDSKRKCFKQPLHPTPPPHLSILVLEGRKGTDSHPNDGDCHKWGRDHWYTMRRHAVERILFYPLYHCHNQFHRKHTTIAMQCIVPC